jgi:hypothetical protein
MISDLYNIQEKLKSEFKTIKALSGGRKSLEVTYCGFYDDIEVWLAKGKRYKTLQELADKAGISLVPAMELLAYKLRMKYPNAKDLSEASGINNCTLAGFYKNPHLWAQNKNWNMIERLIREAG